MNKEMKELLSYVESQETFDTGVTEAETLNDYNKGWNDAVKLVSKKIRKDYLKKAMISQPMHNITDEQILNIRGFAEIWLNDLGYEVVDSYFKKTPNVKNTEIWSLGKSIKMLSECDMLYMCAGWEKDRRCVIERVVALEYGIDVVYETGNVYTIDNSGIRKDSSNSPMYQLSQTLDAGTVKFLKWEF